MTPGWNWEGDESLLCFDDLAAWDAAYESGRIRPLGSAAIGLAFNCTLAEASPRIIRAMDFRDAAERGFAFTAAGTAARLHGELTPQLYAALRAEGPGGFADDAIRDTLTFVPYRQLPPWFKWQMVRMTVTDKLEYWGMLCQDGADAVRKALRRRRDS